MGIPGSERPAQAWELVCDLKYVGSIGIFNVSLPRPEALDWELAFQTQAHFFLHFSGGWCLRSGTLVYRSYLLSGFLYVEGKKI